MKVLLGRKFIVAVLTLVAAFVLAFTGKLTADFSIIASVVNGAFNAADTLITRKSMDAGLTPNREGTEGDL